MSGQNLASPLSHALVCVTAELLKCAEYSSLIDCRRTIAEHMKNPAANVWISIVSHLQESLPNL